jgi:carbon monoxide dehydrogenase subunit G
MKIEQELVVEAPPERVWAILTDPQQVASLLPGAAVTEKVDDRTFKGTMTVKVGPVTTSYRGTVRFERLDRERWEAELVAQGQDVRGRGGAEMKMASRLYPTETGTRVAVASEVNISGILAQLGRGMIETVSGQLFRQFGEALQQKLAGAPPPETPPEALDALSLGAKAVGQAVKRMLGGEAKPG